MAEHYGAMPPQVPGVDTVPVNVQELIDPLISPTIPPASVAVTDAERSKLCITYKLYIL